MSEVLFTSDLHLGHRLASNLRGFPSIEDHDSTVIESIKAMCNKRTVLWILGDVAFKKESFSLLESIPGIKKMVRGNHDFLNMTTYNATFKSIHGFIKYKDFWLSHCPIHPQEMYRCRGNIHGHIHKNSQSPELPLPYFNVNWDFWRQPVSLTYIKDVFDQHEFISESTTY